MQLVDKMKTFEKNCRGGKTSYNVTKENKPSNHFNEQNLVAHVAHMFGLSRRSFLCGSNTLNHERIDRQYTPTKSNACTSSKTEWAGNCDL
jgi:hypothetical protein